MFQTLRRPENYRWVVVVVASLIMGMGIGTLFSISVFLKPLAAEFGWARGQTAFAYTSAAFMGGLGGMVAGRLADRFPTRPIVMCGALMAGGALVLLGFMNSLWQFYLLYGPMMGGFGLAAFLTPLVTNVGFWFTRHRGIAIGAVLAGQSLGGTLVPPLARFLLSQLGWREAYIAMGLGFWAVVLPLAWLLRDAPHAHSDKAAARETARTNPAVTAVSPGALTAALGGAAVLCCYCMSVPIVHLVALGTDQGLAGQSAASVLSLMMFTSIVGRVGIGKVADRIGGLRALLLASFVQTAAIFWFTRMETLPTMYLVAVVFGLGYGGVIPAYAIIVRELIPVHRVGTSMGIVLFFAQMGMGSGGFGGGLLYDLSGSYTLSFASGAVAGLANLAVIGTLYLIFSQRQAALQPRPVPV